MFSCYIKFYNLRSRLLRLMANQFLTRNQSRSNAHCFQLLKKKFGRIRNMNVTKVGCISTSVTCPYALFWVCYCKKTAIFAGVAGEGIRALH